MRVNPKTSSAYVEVFSIAVGMMLLILTAFSFLPFPSDPMRIYNIKTWDATYTESRNNFLLVSLSTLLGTVAVLYGSLKRKMSVLWKILLTNLSIQLAISLVWVRYYQFLGTVWWYYESGERWFYFNHAISHFDLKTLGVIQTPLIFLLLLWTFWSWDRSLESLGEDRRYSYSIVSLFVTSFIAALTLVFQYAFYIRGPYYSNSAPTLAHIQFDIPFSVLFGGVIALFSNFIGLSILFAGVLILKGTKAAAQPVYNKINAAVHLISSTIKVAIRPISDNRGPIKQEAEACIKSTWCYLSFVLLSALTGITRGGFWVYLYNLVGFFFFLALTASLMVFFPFYVTYMGIAKKSIPLMRILATISFSLSFFFFFTLIMMVLNVT